VTVLRQRRQEVARRRIDVLGIEIDVLSVDELNARVIRAALGREHALILNVNAHALNLAARRTWLRRLFNSADLVHADGIGIAVAAKMLGYPVPTRIPITEWIWDLAATAEHNGLSIYLLGGRPGVAERAGEMLAARHPKLKIAGAHDGFFDKVSGSADNEEVLNLINRASPDVLVVAFGMPIQEMWLAQNWSRVGAHVAITGGGVLDYTSQSLRRGPHWMTDNGFEWLSRLVIEPRRLWMRYLIGNPLFLLRVARQRLAAGHR
jgi:N-acetylglucosaminyldiphosphoundecaprenol N-acetyl-beta-D-mannosaminyltransferase